MAHLIDKDALVAEIEKLKERYRQYLTRNTYEDGLKDGRKIGYEDALYKINTLSVKEVDLEKEVKDYIYTLPHSRTGIPGGWKCSWSEEEVIKIVKHFLNLN